MVHGPFLTSASWDDELHGFLSILCVTEMDKGTERTREREIEREKES